MIKPLTRTNSNFQTTATRKLFVALFLVLSSSVFAQNNVADDTERSAPVSTENVSTSQSHGIEMIKWFLGGSAVSAPDEVQSQSQSGKKALINAGMKPNRILNNSLLKKAFLYDCLNA